MKNERTVMRAVGMAERAMEDSWTAGREREGEGKGKARGKGRGDGRRGC